MYKHHNKAILELLKLWGGPEKVYQEYLTDLKNRGLLDKTRESDEELDRESYDSEESDRRERKRKRKTEEFKPLIKEIY